MPPDVVTVIDFVAALYYSAAVAVMLPFVVVAVDVVAFVIIGLVGVDLLLRH